MSSARKSILWAMGILVSSQALSLAYGAGGQERPVLLEGIISSERGEPLVGAIVSVFGANLAGGGIIAVSDESGHYRIAGLPPGLYTLRAYLSGFLPSRSSVVEFEGEATESVSMELRALGEPLAPFEDDAEWERAVGEDEQRTAEFHWILRHAKRNILHQQGPNVESAGLEARQAKTALSSTDPGMTGELGVLGSAGEEGLNFFPGAGAGLDARLAYALLDIPTGPNTRWEVSAQLMESVLSSWAGRAQFFSSGISGEQLTAGVSYGNHLYGGLGDFKPPEAGLSQAREAESAREWFGTVFGAHRFQVGRAVVDTGFTYHHYSYLDDPSYATPRVEVAWAPSPDGGTVLRGRVDCRVLAPGSEDLDLLARMVSADFIGTPEGARRGLRAERSIHSEISVEQHLGDASVVELRVFQEKVDDQLFKAYSKDQPVRGMGAGHFIITNHGDFRTRGLGVTVSRRFGAVESSVGYQFALARALTDSQAPGEERVHDLTTSLQTEIDSTRTRLLAVYRLMSQPTWIPAKKHLAHGVNSRFNVQVYQMLPFVEWNDTTWELMLAIRNLFYEDLESASFLDELAVLDSPRRVLGGVTVRF